jgi:4-amino-4-deoxy-L-arabinose transferase-like glycosyltransferase
MAEGWGTFWKPYQDDTLRPLFHEHPPLIYWIQSIFFKLFGDGIHFEAFYGFIVGIIILCCTALIWQQVRRDFDLEPVGSWWPMLLLVSLPIYTYLSQTNRLVFTFAIFALMAPFYSYKSIVAANHVIFFSLLSGILIYLGFIAKGPVAFFTFAVPVFGWLALKIKFSRAIISTLLTVTTCVILFIVTSYFYPESLNFWKGFWQAQGMASLKSTRGAGDTYWHIPERWALEMIVPVHVVVFLKFITKSPLRRMRFNRQAVLFLLIGLAGSLPFLISKRQHARYIFQSFPFYVLSLAFIADSVAIRLEKILAQKRKYRIAGGSIIALFCITGVVNMFYHKGTITRRHEFYNDFYLQKIQLPQRVTVSVCPEEMIYGDWLFATMQRFYRVSLSGKMNYEYLLIDKNSSCEVPANYQKIHQQATLKYELYKRQSPFLMPEHEP